MAISPQHALHSVRRLQIKLRSLAYSVRPKSPTGSSSISLMWLMVYFRNFLMVSSHGMLSVRRMAHFLMQYFASPGWSSFMKCSISSTLTISTSPFNIKQYIFKLIIVQNTNVVQHTCCQDCENHCLDISLIKMESSESAFERTESSLNCTPDADMCLVKPLLSCNHMAIIPKRRQDPFQIWVR